MSTVSKLISYSPDKHGIITVGGGCFWGTEGLFRKHFVKNGQGVVDVKVGYANGDIDEPSYQQVCAGNTNFCEVVQVVYDPEQVSSKQLYEFFFKIHVPTTRDQQGHNKGSQYRSAIFYHNQHDKAVAEQVISEFQPKFDSPIVTQVVPIKNFYDAEDYHQDYFDKNPEVAYCETHFYREL